MNDQIIGSCDGTDTGQFYPSSTPNGSTFRYILGISLNTSDKTKSPSIKKGLMSIIEGYPQVGVERFELPTPCSQSRCANRTALHPDNKVFQLGE